MNITPAGVSYLKRRNLKYDPVFSLDTYGRVSIDSPVTSIAFCGTPPDLPMYVDGGTHGGVHILIEPKDIKFFSNCIITVQSDKLIIVHDIDWSGAC